MKTISISAILTTITLAACQTNQAALTEQDRVAIEASSRLWVETYNKNDWDALSNLFTPDAVLMPPNGPAVIGRAAIADWEQINESGFRIALDIAAIDGEGDAAYVHGRSCVFIPDGAGGYGVDIGKFLEVRKRQSDGAWLMEADIFNSDLSVGADLLDACPFDTSQTKDR